MCNLDEVSTVRICSLHCPYRAYNELWHTAHVGITDLLTVEMPKVPTKPEKVRSMASEERCNLTSAAQQVLCSSLLSFPLQDKVVAFQKFATMYVKYILIFKRLEDCYDQVHTVGYIRNCNPRSEWQCHYFRVILALLLQCLVLCSMY